MKEIYVLIANGKTYSFLSMKDLEEFIVKLDIKVYTIEKKKIDDD